MRRTHFVQIKGNVKNDMVDNEYVSVNNYLRLPDNTLLDFSENASIELFFQKPTWEEKYNFKVPKELHFVLRISGEIPVYRWKQGVYKSWFTADEVFYDNFTGNCTNWVIRCGDQPAYLSETHTSPISINMTPNKKAELRSIKKLCKVLNITQNVKKWHRTPGSEEQGNCLLACILICNAFGINLRRKGDVWKSQSLLVALGCVLDNLNERSQNDEERHFDVLMNDCASFLFCYWRYITNYPVSKLPIKGRLYPLLGIPSDKAIRENAPRFVPMCLLKCISSCITRPEKYKKKWWIKREIDLGWSTGGTIAYVEGLVDDHCIIVPGALSENHAKFSVQIKNSTIIVRRLDKIDWWENLTATLYQLDNDGDYGDYLANSSRLNVMNTPEIDLIYPKVAKNVTLEYAEEDGISRSFLSAEGYNVEMETFESEHPDDPLAKWIIIKDDADDGIAFENFKHRGHYLDICQDGLKNGNNIVLKVIPSNNNRKPGKWILEEGTEHNNQKYIRFKSTNETERYYVNKVWKRDESMEGKNVHLWNHKFPMTVEQSGIDERENNVVTIKYNYQDNTYILRASEFYNVLLRKDDNIIISDKKKKWVAKKTEKKNEITFESVCYPGQYLDICRDGVSVKNGNNLVLKSSNADDARKWLLKEKKNDNEGDEKHTHTIQLVANEDDQIYNNEQYYLNANSDSSNDGTNIHLWNWSHKFRLRSQDFQDLLEAGTEEYVIHGESRVGINNVLMENDTTVESNDNNNGGGGDDEEKN